MRFYQKIFASKYDSFMTNMEKTLHPRRKDLLVGLEGDILEVGSGTGVNFEHYGAKARVIAIEPSLYMLDKSKIKIPDKSKITTYNLGMGDDELDTVIKDNSLDYIVCTLVLCTIPDQKLAFSKFKKWLKPSGKLIIMEHIHAQNKPKRFLFDVINPFWRVIGEGCNLNRDTDVELKNAGFKVERESYFKETLDFYQAVFSI